MSEMENEGDSSERKFDKCVNDLRDKLIPQDRQANDADLRAICIFGRESTGKTTLARRVYDGHDVKHWFAYRAWVHVPKTFSIGDVLVNVLRQISTQELEDVDLADEQELSSLLRTNLRGRYLVVLDNVDKEDFIVDTLKHLMDLRNGSRLIITTRNDKLSAFDPYAQPIHVPRLTEEERKELLLGCPHGIMPNCHMRKILSWSSLSPAGIRLLGGLLSITPDSQRLKAMIRRQEHDPSLQDTVSLCYDELSHSLQSCIMYVSQFPREYEIPTRRLLRLWLAEKLLTASQGGIQDAEACFRELVRRNMIHVVSRGKGHGFAKTCRMPGFMYDFLLRKASETLFFEIYSNDSSTNIPKVEPRFAALRVVVDKSRKPEGSLETQTRYNVKQLRSYVSLNTKKFRMQRRELDFILNPKGEKSSLEVLDLEGVYKPVLPKNLGDVLSNLKYLGLRWTILDELPKSVGNLSSLETLDVKHTNITKVARSIWTKKSLRHLYLNELSLGKSISHGWWRSSSSKMPNGLETLCGLHIEGNSPMLKVLSKLTRVTKLSLTCASTVVEEIIPHIRKLSRLQSLRLKSKNLLGQPTKLHLEGMEEIKSCLSNLYLFGGLEAYNLSYLPKCLKSLTLSMSFLITDPMNDLSTLEDLTDLRLYAFSYDGTTLTCSRKTFCQLRILKLWKLCKLESLIVQHEAMPCLEELDIRDCQNLREIQVLGDRTALKEVRLAKVKKEVAESLEADLGGSVIITTELIASTAVTEEFHPQPNEADNNSVEQNGDNGTSGIQRHPQPNDADNNLAEQNGDKRTSEIQPHPQPNDADNDLVEQKGDNRTAERIGEIQRHPKTDEADNNLVEQNEDNQTSERIREIH